MARVTVEDCVERIPNRFDLVMMAAQRSRNISAGAPLTVEADNDKNHVISLREIADLTVDLKELEEQLIQSMQRHVETDEPEEDELDMISIQQEILGENEEAAPQPAPTPAPAPEATEEASTVATPEVETDPTPMSAEDVFAKSAGNAFANMDIDPDAEEESESAEQIETPAFSNPVEQETVAPEDTSATDVTPAPAAPDFAAPETPEMPEAPQGFEPVPENSEDATAPEEGSETPASNPETDESEKF